MKIILNGNKILTIQDLVENINHQSKTKKLGFEIENIFSLTNFLPQAAIFSIWHCDSFLKNESKENIKKIINFFAKNFNLNLTGKYKKVLEDYLR